MNLYNIQTNERKFFPFIIIFDFIFLYYRFGFIYLVTICLLFLSSYLYSYFTSSKSTDSMYLYMLFEAFAIKWYYVVKPNVNLLIENIFFFYSLTLYSAALCDVWCVLYLFCLSFFYFFICYVFLLFQQISFVIFSIQFDNLVESDAKPSLLLLS